MLLEEKGIEEFISTLEYNSYNIDSLEIKFNPLKNRGKNPFAILRVNGVPGIQQEEEYYVNLEDHIVAMNYSWIEPLCKTLNVPLEAIVPVNMYGELLNDSVKLKTEIHIPAGVENIYSFLYNRLKSFVLFYPFIEKIRIRGYKGRITQLTFYMTIDSKLVNRTLNENLINHNILEQWLLSVDKCEKENSQLEQFDNQFDIINGKINYQYKMELVSYYFDLKKVIRKKESDNA